MTNEYTGAVSVGGPFQTRTAGDLDITKLAVGPMDNNAYFLRCRTTGDVALIDAANEPDRLLATLAEVSDGGQALSAIITTHQHGDHWQALPEMIAATGAPVIAHPLDAGALPVTSSTAVVDGDTISVGDCSLDVIHLVGHTPGSIALVYDDGERKHIFTGDCLFPGGAGNTEQDPERFTSLLDGLEAKVFGTLPDDTWVYPGHGGDTTIGTERPQLAEWRARGW